MLAASSSEAGELALLEILERGGHLFQVVDLRELWDGTLSGNYRPDFIRIKSGAQDRSPQAGVLILPRSQERNHAAPPMLYPKASLIHEPQKRREVGWLFHQDLHDGQPYPLLCGGWLFPDPLAIMEKAALAVLFRILDNRKLMLNAHPVREPPQSKGRADEVMKLPGAVLGRGIEINMVMRVPLVNMGTDEKLVLAFCPAHGCFIADFVCLLRRDLAGRERLPDLKEQGPALHGPARFRLVLAFRQKKLSGGR